MSAWDTHPFAHVKPKVLIIGWFPSLGARLSPILEYAWVLAAEGAQTQWDNGRGAEGPGGDSSGCCMQQVLSEVSPLSLTTNLGAWLCIGEETPDRLKGNVSLSTPE